MLLCVCSAPVFQDVGAERREPTGEDYAANDAKQARKPRDANAERRPLHPPMTRRRRGAIILESAMWIPIMVLLLMGMVELARVTYTYYSLHKLLYTIARLVGTGQGTAFCSDTNSVQDTVTFALNGGNVEARR